MRLTPEQVEELLRVARSHGTTVAAEWGNVHTHTVLRLRRLHDGYSRGSGHPSRAEMEAAAVRDDCQCPRCRAARGVNFPPLTTEQQATVEANRGLVGFVIRRFGLGDREYDDAFQDGLLGLMRAAQLYEPATGFRFSTYAIPWIRESMHRGQGRLEGRNWRAAQDRPAAGNTWSRPTSLDSSVDDDGDLTLGSLIPDTNAVDPEASAVAAARASELLTVARTIARNERDHLIVDALFTAATGSWSARDQQIADRVGLSREIIRRRRREIQDQLAAYLANADLEATA